MKHGLKFDGVAIAGIGMVRFGMYKEIPGAHLARDAGLAALHDAGMTLADVDEAFVGYIQPASMLGIKAMKELGLTGLPVTHIENASATGLVAFREAAWAVSSGRAEVAMALCFDKFTDMVGTGGRGAGRDQIDAPILPAAYFALWAQRRMHDRGTTPEHFATIAAKNWNYGAVCPFAHRQSDHVVTAEEVLAARMVAEPLTTMMCCPPDDGAACIIVAREDLVRSRQPDRPLVRALASALTSETYSPGHTFVGPVVGPATSDAGHRPPAHEAAGLGPEDVSVAYCHDAFVNEELEYYELLGFCPEGDGEKLVVEGETGPEGRIPFNTDGGLLARGGIRAAPRGRPCCTRRCLQLRARGVGSAGGRGQGCAHAPRRGRQHRDSQFAWGGRSRIMTTSDERRAAGREIQGQLWPAILKGPTGQFPAAKLAPDFFDHVQQSAFGDIWTRPGLPVRDRSMITVAVLAALGQPEELRSHLAGALNVGISREEIVEILMHVSIYAGVPAAGSALRVAADVLGTD